MLSWNCDFCKKPCLIMSRAGVIYCSLCRMSYGWQPELELIKRKIKTNSEEIIDYYYNPNVKCTCEAIFADTHRGYCKRRVRPR